MKKCIALTMALAGTLLFSSPLMAMSHKDSNGKKQEAGMSESGSKMGQQMPPEKYKGMEVVSDTGEKVGTVKDVAVDQNTGTILWLTVYKDDVGGTDHIAIPPKYLDFDQDKAVLKAVVSVDSFGNAPKQGNRSDIEYERELERHYGTAPGWKRDGAKAAE